MVLIGFAPQWRTLKPLAPGNKIVSKMQRMYKRIDTRITRIIIATESFAARLCNFFCCKVVQ